MDSSFSRLFRQSRYGRGTDDGEIQSKQNRCELFAVAAVAFVAKHDDRFAQDFLERIAGVPSANLKHRFRFEPQKAYCADLLITDEATGETYVIEFKIGARLMEKQRSGDRAFESLGGYGDQIRKLFPATKTYTVLAEQKEFEDTTGKGLERRSRTWKDLIPLNGRESSLVADLLDCLGDFGVSALRVRKVHKMKNATHAVIAVNIYDLLRSILNDFSKVGLNVETDEIYTWAVGMYIRPRRGQERSLIRWLGQNWGFIGWIGYLLPRDSKRPQLSVWLSFDKRARARREMSITNLRKFIRTGEVQPSKVYTDLVVTIEAAAVSDEKQWFSETLDIVLGHAMPRK